MGQKKGNPKMDVHIHTGLHKKDRNISNEQPNPTATRTGGATINRAQSK